MQTPDSYTPGPAFGAEVEKGGSVTFNFKATIEGRFEVELENAGTQIANLEVTP